MSAASMTLRELISIDSLKTELVAGAEGLDRHVLWGHSCELEEPWQWLGESELLLTVGFCVPQEPAEQVRFVRELDQSGVVGAMIGARDSELSLTLEMIAEADRLGFPLMRTKPEVPWSAISRHIAAANSISQTSQVLTVAKLYELTAAGYTPAELAAQISRLLAVQLRVVDLETGQEVLSSHPEQHDEPGNVTDGIWRSYLLKSHFRGQLDIREPRAEKLGSMVFMHLKRILEVEYDRIMFGLLEAVGQSEREVARLIETGSSEYISTLLTQQSTDKAYAVIAVAVSEYERLARASQLSQLPAAVGKSHASSHMIVRDADLPTVKRLIADLEIQAGASSTFERLSDTAGALDEARSALKDAQLTGSTFQQFRGANISILARSAREARLIIANVLGPLAEDTDRASTLRETLFVYLEHERSWLESSETLGVHRQTLAYRLRQIEAMTNRSMSRTEDIASFWIAMKAWQRYCLSTDDHSE